jgi:2-iminobutanoate/2-iminopropanoate deaminase
LERKVISTGDAPAAIGPYSQGIAASTGPGASLVFVSGQTPLNGATGELVEGGIPEQTARCLANLAAILAAAGSSPGKVLKTTVFLTDMADFKAMNEVYAKFFGAEPPARSTVAVAGLPLGARVEIEAVALAATGA